MGKYLKKEFFSVLSETDESPWILAKISSENELLSMIPNVENLIRKSHEYRIWLATQRARYGLNVTMDTFSVNTNEHKITSEFHHTPFTLFDICYIVGMKQLKDLPEGEFLTSFDVAKEVVVLHMANKVGAMLLSKTTHELTHYGLNTVQPQDISGDYDSFITEYKDFITEDIKMRAEQILNKKI